MAPPSIESFGFIHPGGLHGDEKRNSSGFALRASRSMGRMYALSWSIENFFSSGSGSGLSSKL